MQYKDRAIYYAGVLAGLSWVIFNKFEYAVWGALVGLIVSSLQQMKLWREEKQTRYVPDEVKNNVMERYFNSCAVCSNSEKDLFEFHHKVRYSDGGDNSEENIVPLCPRCHSIVTRYIQNGGNKNAYRN